MSEVTLGSIYLDDDFERHHQASPSIQPSFKLQDSIFKYEGSALALSSTKTVSHITDSGSQGIIQKHYPVFGSASGKVGITYEWGDKDGGSLSGYASGSVSDDSGNKAEVEVTVNDDGTGSISVEASHEEDNE